MAPQPPGPKELMLRQMREDRASKVTTKPSTAALRGTIAKIKGSNQKLRKGGRKR